MITTPNNRTTFTVGGRYSFVCKHQCYRTSLDAINNGYAVSYGVSPLGLYYFEITERAAISYYVD